ncbi:MAG: hypothetical protein DRN27_08585 [Thermoplasmata archaeon]|nr:MAG: hypothetical protein DRN27_08585 [Thermoplasmata archaeon]
MKRLLSIVIMGLFLVGCEECSASNPTNKETVEEVKLFEKIYDSYNIDVVVDRETGCEYVYYSANSRNFTPRLNSDGKPKCDPKNIKIKSEKVEKPIETPVEKPVTEW